ncbi:S26 family signal peptidase [Novosphingobium terrae]|uniref:S26 family signal peptidase n=1 Tax=Novosphingobium terrae TaxID=2726189 RepID=UPI0019827017
MVSRFLQVTSHWSHVAPPRRVAWLFVIGGIGLGALATSGFHPRPLVIWNASGSMPLGLYIISTPVAVRTGDVVVARLPAGWRKFASQRRYIPSTVPILKRVAAMTGDAVCAQGAIVTINGREVARRRLEDGQGRSLPWWRGCMVIPKGGLFLLAQNAGSFDGRYLGPSRQQDLIGKARPIWTF